MYFVTYIGSQIDAVFEPLAALRMAVFHDFPYLYAGTVAFEQEYLKTYSDAPDALLFAAYDGDRMIGATTCIPLTNETEEVQAPFLKAGLDPSDIFYFGESILLPQYRGLGIGHRFFDVREAHAASFGACQMTCFCAVERPQDHPMRPTEYRPLDTFWEKRGYRKAPDLRTEFSWPDIGEQTPSIKMMQFWTRNIPPKPS